MLGGLKFPTRAVVIGCQVSGILYVDLAILNTSRRGSSMPLSDINIYITWGLEPSLIQASQCILNFRFIFVLDDRMTF